MNEPKSDNNLYQYSFIVMIILIGRGQCVNFIEKSTDSTEKSVKLSENI